MSCDIGYFESVCFDHCSSQVQRSETIDKEDEWFGTPDIPFPGRVSDLIRRMSGGRRNDTVIEEENTTMEIGENIPDQSSTSLVSPIVGRANENRRSSVPKQESPSLIDAVINIKCESPVVAISTQVEPDVQGQDTLQLEPAVPQGPQRRTRRRRIQKQSGQQITTTTPNPVAEQLLAQNSPQKTVVAAAAGSTITRVDVVEGPAVIDLGVRSCLLFLKSDTLEKNCSE